MKKIIISALLFSPLVYGKMRVPRVELPLVTREGKLIIVDGKVNGKARQMTFPYLDNVPEEVQLNAAQTAETVEGCGVACYSDILYIANRETPFDSPEYRALKAIQLSPVYLEGVDADTVMETLNSAADIVNEAQQGAVIHASYLSSEWNDPKAQKQVPATAKAWAGAAGMSRDGSTVRATKILFGLNSMEEAKQREQDIVANCQAP